MLIELYDLLGKGKIMNITSIQKKWVLVGILVMIGGGAAFVFFDPLGLDLLGQKGAPAVAVPKAPPRAAAPKVQPHVAAPASAPVATPSAASRVAAPAVSAPVATPSVAAAVQAPQPPFKFAEPVKTANTPSQSGKTASSTPANRTKQNRPKDSDLRDCLNLETDAAIAKCAGE